MLSNSRKKFLNFPTRSQRKAFITNLRTPKSRLGTLKGTVRFHAYKTVLYRVFLFFSLFWLGAYCGYFLCFTEGALHWEMVCSLSARREQSSYLVWVVASLNQCWRHLRLLHILILFGLECLESAPLQKSMLTQIVRLLHCLQKQRLSKGTQFLAVFFFRFSVCFVEPYPIPFHHQMATWPD